jgi:ribonuclease P protein subunit RPR2
MAKKIRGRKPAWQKSIAKERIELLFEEAEKSFKERPNDSHRYIQLAREMGMRYRVRIPKELKRLYCKNCKKYIKPGVNATVRLSQKRFSKVVITCKECGDIRRIPYKKSK